MYRIGTLITSPDSTDRRRGNKLMMIKSMLGLAVKRRDDDPRRLWLNDIEAAAILGMNRTTLLSWVADGLAPPPKRVGKVLTQYGRTRSRKTSWLRADIELFAECGTMKEYKRRKRQMEQ